MNYVNCELCPRCCGVNRKAGELGYCRCPDTAVVDIGVYMMTTMMPSYILFVFIEVYSGALRGLSDVFIPTLITMGGVIFIRIPMVFFVVPKFPTLFTVIMSYPISWAVTVLLFIPYYMYRKRNILRERTR